MKHEHSIRIMWYRVSCFFLLTTYSSYSQDVTEEDWIPHFGEPIANVTVPLGREAILSCTVRNLGLFKVGWLRAEDQTVLSLDKRVVTHNSRISVSQDTDRDTWRLHIRQIKYSDRGCYMCQINTTKMKKQVGCLDVHVPPDIIDSGTSSDTVMEEGDNVTLVCTARGHPPPRIVWRREDGRSITVYNNSTGFSTVDSYNGERLDLVKVDYTQMGAYLCIATNDIPPAVSKRIVLRINFAPVARQANQMVGAVLGTTVNLACEFHGYPNDNTSWYREIGEIHEYGGDYKVRVSRTSYQVTLHLAIRNVRAIDLGRYFCSLTNILGTSRATIQLYEIHVETTTTPTTTTTTIQPTTSPATSTTTEMPFTVMSTDRGDLETTDTNEIEEMALFNEVDSKRGAEASSRRRTYTVSSSTKMSVPIEIFSIILISLTIIR